jgi:hypothetical protein
MNADFMDRMKIYLQLLGNTQTLNKIMPLRDYAEYVLSSENTGISKS